MYKLGKTPARKGAVKFKLAHYLDTSALPTPPAQFGHEGLVKDWKMLGNDNWGDCVWAGAAHEAMMWNREAGTTVNFTDRRVLSDYSAATGFNPNDPSTDQGTDMQAAASYRRKRGIIDTRGKRHKIAAYLEITPGDLQEHLLALYLFGAVGLGLSFPQSAMDEFDANQPWDVVINSPEVGGHYVPLVAQRDMLMCVTWGRLQRLTDNFLARYNDESVAYVSVEALTNNVSPEGFNAAQLKADLAALPGVK